MSFGAHDRLCPFWSANDGQAAPLAWTLLVPRRWGRATGRTPSGRPPCHCRSRDPRRHPGGTDLPAVTYGDSTARARQQITEGLLTTFRNQGIPAIGFVNEDKLEPGGRLDERRVAPLRRWVDSGLQLRRVREDDRPLAPSSEWVGLVRDGPPLVERGRWRHRRRMKPRCALGARNTFCIWLAPTLCAVPQKVV